MIWSDFLSRQTHDNGDPHDIIPNSLVYIKDYIKDIKLRQKRDI